MGKWLTVGVDKPEIGKTYVVLTSDGKYQIRRWVKGYVDDYNSLTEDLSHKPYKSTGEIEEGFITVGGWIGRKSNKVLYFYELPTLPQELEGDKRVRAKIAMLEAETKRLKKQLKEQEAANA